MAHLRGKSVAQAARTSGAMLAVGLSVHDVAKYIEEHSSTTITIAAVNSPSSVTLSGDREVVEAVKLQLDQEGVFSRLLKTGGMAYHSADMRGVGELYEVLAQEALVKLPPGELRPRIPFYSTVYGKRLKDEKLGPRYWRRNLEQSVLFAPALKTLIEQTDRSSHVLIEVGPHLALKSPIHQITAAAITDNKDVRYLSSIRRGGNNMQELFNLAGNLFLHGTSLDTQKVNTSLGHSEGKFIVDLPTYSWKQDKVIDSENRWSKEWRLREFSRHDLLGSRTPGGLGNLGNGPGAEWRNHISIKDLPWLGDHCVSI
jgi:acyl transferase domain-containing protein